MAFDNCTELERWRDLTEFVADMNRGGERLHFTFFVSGTNLIANASRMLYQGPRQRRGYSSINFGGSADEVTKRVEFINALHRAGHEIASHAVGHFNGATWSSDEWRQELRAYSDVIDKVAAHNGLPETTRLIFDAHRVQGIPRGWAGPLWSAQGKRLPL
jgi:peptidoglycan/xylan/chitin deacetylase (PgdA/CDA1 family)